MTIFTDKLSTLADTVRLGENEPFDLVSTALGQGKGRSAVAIGSGGSAITAEYFARCRATLGLGVTIVQTPMQFVMAQSDWSGFDIWLFSAGADNPDAVAALTTARNSGAERIYLMTANPDGSAAIAASTADRVALFVVPVSERKDGFLATHSLMAMITCLVTASELVADRARTSISRSQLAERVIRALADPANQAPGFQPGDTVMVLHDPQCATLAALIETSLWETGIAPVQRTDFRNFAHGRHVWAAKHPGSMYVIAITTSLSRTIWDNILDALPTSIRTTTIDLGQAGRMDTAASVATGLAMIDAMGNVVGTDPGKPGRGDFASAIYDDNALAELATDLDGSVRHKLEAIGLHDDPGCAPSCAFAARADWRGMLSAARIKAVVLDYDGTLVTTERRLDPPSDALIAELTRLADANVSVAFATGRGGSAGEALRAALPHHLHKLVTIGYYNGGYIHALDVDIRECPPEQNGDLAALADWIATEKLLRPGITLDSVRIQITIKHADVLAPGTFAASLTAFPAVADGKIKVVSSHHSFDLLPAATTKTAVTSFIRDGLEREFQVLAIGDSGEPGGNDSELLALAPSISVDGVCGRLSGSWSIFGKTISGPAALLRILRALIIENGHARLDVDSLVASPT